MARGGSAARSLVRLSRASADLAMLAWLGLLIVVGVLVAREIRDLASVGQTVSSAGSALEEAGGSLRSLGDVPLVGGVISDAGTRLEEAGASLVEDARSSRRAVETSGMLLGLTIVLVPAVSVFVPYVARRASQVADVRAVRRALQTQAVDPAFRRFLARRAIEHLPYRRLLSVSPNPERDLDEGRYDALADAELARLGISDVSWRGR